MAKLAVCVSALLLLLVVLSETSRPVPCCTKTSKDPIRLLRLKNYTTQNDTGTCNIKAVIFITVKNRLVCADPEVPWVIRAQKYLDEQK